ncbi:hypothetical protein [uncultured Thiodictyon sp.]|uniref:hypothetical protein n=1 Tax=uncultured Thiodictyon sp. TaxID=1846217 RepID=UPI0025F8959E|nr:hypothetical protein [uncultured Thiodictyon sp.]
MPPRIQDKLAAIIAEIDSTGHANTTRLTVLKKWFEHPRRLRAFGLWVAERAAARGDAATGETAELFAEARALLTERPLSEPMPGWTATEVLQRRLVAFQNTFRDHPWGRVRIIKNKDLLLIEEGLALYLGQRRTPYDGYRLAADDCEHYDPHFGTNLNGPARERVTALIAFVTTTEAREGESLD